MHGRLGHLTLSAAGRCRPFRGSGRTAPTAAGYQGMLVRLLSTDRPASSVITQEPLGWKPAQPGLIEDIEQGHCFS